MSGAFEHTGWVWRDGEIIPWEEATLHVMSHVVHYGTSVFEGIRCYETPEGLAAFRLHDHLRRFLDSCRIYRFEMSYDADDLESAVSDLVGKNDLGTGYIRPVAFRGVGAPGLNPYASPVVTTILCWPWGEYLGEGALADGVDARVATWRRPAPDTFPIGAKAGGHYMNAQLIKMEAVDGGYAEAIALNTDGTVSEGSGQNVFLVRDGTVFTPAVDGSFLAGITRDTVLTLAREEGLTVREERVPRETLYTADELFFTGTASEVTPVRSVDGISVGGGGVGPVTRRLQERYMSLVRGESDDPRGWRVLL